MLRTAMKPRLVRLFIVMLAFVAAFVWLGNWQWRTAHNKANQKVLEQSASRTVEPLDDVLKPQTQFDNSRSLQPVRVTGTYDGDKTRLVAGRVLGGRDGWWLMTPLVVDSTGARLPIVRGFVTQTSHLPKPASGTVTLDGALAPGESVSQLTDLPAGQIGTIDMGLLLNEWNGSVYNAFVFSTKQTPPDARAAGDAAVAHIPPPVPTTTKLDWRNAAYAWQWWIFAIFAVFMWVKLVREEHLDDLASAEPSPSATEVDATNTSHPNDPRHPNNADHRTEAHASTPAAAPGAARKDTT